MKKKLRENQTWYKGIEDDGDCDYVEDVTEDYSDDYINEKYENLIGKKIRIINMDDPYAAKDYNGREGVIENVATDPWGDIYYDGTWGGLSIYPKIDEIKFIDNNDSYNVSEDYNKKDFYNKILPEVKQKIENREDPYPSYYLLYFPIDFINDLFVNEKFRNRDGAECVVKKCYYPEGSTDSSKILVDVSTDNSRYSKKNWTSYLKTILNDYQFISLPPTKKIYLKKVIGNRDYFINKINQFLNNDSNKASEKQISKLLNKFKDTNTIKNKNESVQEGLFDIAEDKVDYGHKAWLLNEIISSMNDETAYYDTEWLYIWPDGESYEECIEDFGDKQSFKELENTFLSIYQYNDAEDGEDPEDAEYNFHRDGLYNPTQEAVDLAHQYDRKLGLSPIKVLGTIKK